LIWYFWSSKNFEFSVAWSLIYILIFLGIGILSVALDLHERFPELDRFHFSAALSSEANKTFGNTDPVLHRAVREIESLEIKQYFTTPTEDALVCVPALLVGISPISAIVGGLVFGIIHLGRFTYLECIAKWVGYSAVIYLVLPQGLLTVIAGHFVADFLILGFLKFVAEPHLRKMKNVD